MMKKIQYSRLFQSRKKGTNEIWETEFSFSGNTEMYYSEGRKDFPNKEFRDISNPKYVKYER